MRRIGESTFVHIDDAEVQSLEELVSEAEALIGNGDEPGARRWLLAELAAIRLGSRRAELAIHRCANDDDVRCEEDDVQTLWVDTDIHGNHWWLFRRLSRELQNHPFHLESKCAACSPRVRRCEEVVFTLEAKQKAGRQRQSLPRDAGAGGHRLLRTLCRSAERSVVDRK